MKIDWMWGSEREVRIMDNARLLVGPTEWMMILGKIANQKE